MRKTLRRGLPVLLLALLVLLTATAGAEEGPEEAADLTGNCQFRLSRGGNNASRITDGKYTTYWSSGTAKKPYVIIASDTPMYGLYLCFRTMPASYVIQTTQQSNAARSKTSEVTWQLLREGETRFHHVFIPLEGEKAVRVQATEENPCEMGFNEVFVFGEGIVPDWVQRWEPTEEKADLLFLSTHPDDELLFFGGAIPTYAGEKQTRVVVAYFTYSNPTRRSEALNGLWHLGVRHYPVFGEFRDVYSRNPEEAYKKVKGGEDTVHGWLTEILRRVRPEVVVTQDLNGEYGHGQHKMVAESAVACYDLAAQTGAFPESEEAFGLWQVRKLYLHLWGAAEEQTVFDWEQPLAAFGGKTGTELAEEAFAMHVTQRGSGIKLRGKRYTFSVRETGGVLFPNTLFGLCRTEVGPDEARNDFLEHLETAGE